jgi:hypothetical protein
MKVMKKKTKQLFQYPHGFSGVELLQSKNEDETEFAAWISNPTGPGGCALLGLVRPEDWDEFQDDFDTLMSKYIVPLNEA